MSQNENLQNFVNFQKFQLENLVDLKNAAKRIFSRKNRCRCSRKQATFCRTFAKNWQLDDRHEPALRRAEQNNRRGKLGSAVELEGLRLCFLQLLF